MAVEGEALFRAVNKGTESVVKLLLEHNADVNRYTSKDESLLLRAVIKRDLNVVQMLLQAGANVNHCSNNGRTPLSVAVDIMSVPLVRTLLEHGADPNAQHESRPVLLSTAIRAGHTEITELLLRHGAKVNEINTKLGSPIQALARKTDATLTKLFLNYWTEAKSQESTTSFMQAMQAELIAHPEDLRLTRYLLQNGFKASFNRMLLLMQKPRHYAVFVPGFHNAYFFEMLVMADIPFAGVLDSIQNHRDPFWGKLVRKRLSTPLTLKQACIKRVRRALGVPHLWKKIDALSPLPSFLSYELKLIILPVV